jgi:hypothetical protein
MLEQVATYRVADGYIGSPKWDGMEKCSPAEVTYETVRTSLKRACVQLIGLPLPRAERIRGWIAELAPRLAHCSGPRRSDEDFPERAEHGFPDGRAPPGQAKRCRAPGAEA